MLKLVEVLHVVLVVVVDLITPIGPTMQDGQVMLQEVNEDKLLEMVLVVQVVEDMLVAVVLIMILADILREVVMGIPILKLDLPQMVLDKHSLEIPLVGEDKLAMEQ